MRLFGLINLGIGISILSISMVACFLIKLLIICWFLRKTQNLLLDIRYAEIMLVASVILLSAMVYCICLIPSIEFITIAWFIFGVTELAVVSAKLLTWELFVGEIEAGWVLLISLVVWLSWVGEVLGEWIWVECFVANNFSLRDSF